MYLCPINCLLISRCPTVIEQVKGAATSVSRLQVEVCSVQRAHSRLRRPDVGLILAHLGPGEEGVTRLLWSVEQAGRPCPTVVLCNRLEEHQAASLRRAGAADYVSLPEPPVLPARCADAPAPLHPRRPAGGPRV
jgi:DNA-binding NarL/FixJ family response regulator